MKSNQGNNPEAVHCPTCGGEIDLRQNEEEIVKCPYCGNVYNRSVLLQESDEVRSERIRSKAYKDIEARRQKLEKERLEFEKEESRRREISQRSFEFRHSRQRRAAIGLLILAILCGMSAFYMGAVIAGLLSIVTIIFCVLCLLTGSQTIREKHRGMHTLYFVLALVTVIPFMYSCAGGSTDSPDVQTYSWDDIVLHEQLPEPPSDQADISLNSERYLSIEIYRVSKDEYTSYLSACKERGFTTDAEQYGDHLNAFNAEGYHLLMSYIEDDHKIDLMLDAPMEMSQITWPQSALAQTLPEPKSLEGNVQSDTSEHLSVYIGNMTRSDFKDYADACAAAGYNLETQRGDTWFHADNEAGNHLSLQYRGANVINIQLEASTDQ